MNQREYTVLKKEEGQSFGQIAMDLKVAVFQVEGWYHDEIKKRKKKEWEEREKEREENLIKWKEGEKEREEEFIQWKIELQKDETKAYNKLIWDTHHTENWGVEHDCRYDDCDGKIARKVLSHYKNKYAFIECTLCGRHQKWLRYPI